MRWTPLSTTHGVTADTPNSAHMMSCLRLALSEALQVGMMEGRNKKDVQL